jgi:hypothetical protein
VDGVADPALEGPQRLFVRLSLGNLLFVMGAAVAVGVADLGDRGHVDGVVDAPVPARRQPADLAVPGGDLDRRGAVAGGEMGSAGEPGHVSDVADHGGGDDRAGAEDLRRAGARRADRRCELLLRLEHLLIQAAHVRQDLDGQVGTGRPGGAVRLS